MFEIDKKPKPFKDSVHGYIYVPRIFVEKLIDTPGFQRLRNIEQTGMRVVYPSARHDRFAHSLGCFYLGQQAVDALMQNFKEKLLWNVFSDDKTDVFWAKNKVLFLIACLLHDVGHAPFSHTLEDMYVEPINGASYNAISKKLKDLFSEDECKQFYMPSDGGEKGVGTKFKAQPHEIVSALMVADLFKPNIEEILEALKKEEFPSVTKPKAEYEPPMHVVDSNDIDDDIKFIIRMITGCKYESVDPRWQIRNCFIELLNGKSFDVDKLDYIIRDTQMSGIENIAIDIERLVRGITIVPVTCFQDYDLNADSGGFGTKECPALILNIRPGVNDVEISLKGDMIGDISCKRAEKVEICAHAFVGKIDGKASVKGVDGEASGHPEQVIFHIAFKQEQNFSLRGGLDISLADIHGNIEINGTGIFSSSLSFYGEIRGNVTMEVLGDQLESRNILQSKNAYNSYRLGFRKSAPSVIQNVSMARNYLYLWVYAHHKVVYSANYLTPEMLILAAKINNKGLNDYISYESARCVDDIEIIKVFRDTEKKSQEIIKDNEKGLSRA